MPHEDAAIEGDSEYGFPTHASAILEALVEEYGIPAVVRELSSLSDAFADDTRESASTDEATTQAELFAKGGARLAALAEELEGDWVNAFPDAEGVDDDGDV